MVYTLYAASNNAAVNKQIKFIDVGVFGSFMTMRSNETITVKFVA